MSSVKPGGKRNISFSPGAGTVATDLPCGQCIGCRLERSRQWATRIMHEASLHEQNSFITLTYNAENIPSGRTLVKKHAQDFLKRLRKLHSVRFFACGEYGSLNLRPHYHFCIFGWSFPDRLFYKVDNGNCLYISSELSKLWPFGFSTVGNLSFASAAYVARYCLKKWTGASAEKHYESLDEETGEIISRLPEYVHCSLKPGIGAGWFARFGRDVYPSDEVIINGHSCKPPRFYDELLKRQSQEAYENIKNKRALDMHLPDRQLENDSIRSKAKSLVASASSSQLRRSI